jgi:hypothetical protein
MSLCLPLWNSANPPKHFAKFHILVNVGPNGENFTGRPTYIYYIYIYIYIYISLLLLFLIETYDVLGEVRAKTDEIFDDLNVIFCKSPRLEYLYVHGLLIIIDCKSVARYLIMCVLCKTWKAAFKVLWLILFFLKLFSNLNSMENDRPKAP